MVCKIVPQSDVRQRGATEIQDVQQEEVDYETALDTAGYGRFSRTVLGVCSCAFFTTGVENCVMSYVLPAARCELSLTTYQAGLVNMAFMCGGTASAFFWGIAGDVIGRRNVLSLTLLLDSVILLAQSIVSDYRLLLAARTVNGFLIGGTSTLVFTYLSDLVGSRSRQLYLTITGMSFVAAWLLLPAFAWLIIPISSATPTIWPVYSWRLYLLLGSIPGFISGIWMLFLPESPRLLADTNRSDAAVKILQRIHKANEGGEEFKVKKLISDNLMPKTLTDEQNRTKGLLFAVLKDLKQFVSKKYAVKSTLILFVFFANMAAGFGLNLWIPELFFRMQNRDCRESVPEAKRLSSPDHTWNDFGATFDFHNTSNTSSFLNDLGEAAEEQCHDHIETDIYISGIIVGAICVLGNAACAIICARGGARGVRTAAAACALVCAVACACLAACACSCIATNKVAVAAAAALNAASLNGNVLLIRMLFHALPAKLSGLGVCWGAWWGRAGGVVSNLAVGVLLDYSCPAPFLSVAALLALSVAGIMMIKYESGDENTSSDPSTDEDDYGEKNVGLDRYITTHM